MEMQVPQWYKDGYDKRVNLSKERGKVFPYTLEEFMKVKPLEYA